MNNKSLMLFAFGVFTFMLVVSSVSAVKLAEWPFLTDGVATTVVPNVNAGTFTLNGVSDSFPFTAARAQASGWTTALNTGKYFEVKISPKADYNLTISSIAFDYASSIAGPVNFELRYSKQSSFASPQTMIIKDDVAGSSGDPVWKTSTNASLNIYVGPGETLTLRWFAYGSAFGPASRFFIKDLDIQGSTVLIPNPSFSISSATIPSDSNKTTFTITNNGNIDLTNIQLSASNEYSVEFNNTGFNLNAGESASVLVTRITSLNSLEFGLNKIVLTATANGGTSAISILTSMRDFFEGSNKGELEISDIQFNTLNGFGDDENYWYPLDEVEIRFDVDNNGDWDIQNIEINVCLYDLRSKKCVLDEGDMDLSNDKFDVDSDDSQRVTLTFDVNPDNLREGNKDYTLFISAEGEVDDNDSPFDGDKTGTSSSQDIEIRTNEEFIIVTDVQIPSSVSCGQTAQITANVWNIGDNDLDDDEVFLRVSNSNLGLGETLTFTRGIRAMESEPISFSFTIPSDAKETQYPISFVAYDDKDLGTNDVIENNENNEARYVTYLSVKCSSSQDILVSASLESEAKAGSEMSIKVTLENTGSKISSLVLEPTGYQSWADVSSVPPIITIAPESSGEGVIKFNVKNDASGTQQFNINVYSGSDLVATQAVSVNIESKSGFGITGLAIGDNAALWGFGLLNIILLIIIIIVAVRVARK